jgi:hypothetical protein
MLRRRGRAMLAILSRFLARYWWGLPLADLVVKI